MDSQCRDIFDKGNGKHFYSTDRKFFVRQTIRKTLFYCTSVATLRLNYGQNGVRVKTDDGLELSTICRQLKLKATDRKMRLTDLADTKTLSVLSRNKKSHKPKSVAFLMIILQRGWD